jgi:hypothetical protein
MGGDKRKLYFFQLSAMMGIIHPAYAHFGEVTHARESGPTKFFNDFEDKEDPEKKLTAN